MKSHLRLQTLTIGVVVVVVACTTVLVAPELIGGGEAGHVPAMMAQVVVAHP